MPSWTIFIQGFLFSLSLCFDLGMVNLAIMKAGMERGLRPSFALGFGSCFGDLVYLILALLGVSFIFQIVWIKWALWIVGSVVLLYLTLKMLIETWRPKALAAEGGSTGAARPLFGDWLAGVLLAMASPTSIVWFALVGGPLLATMPLGQGAGLVYFGLGFFTAGLLWSLGVACMSSLSGKVFGTSMVRVFSLASALLFLYFAVKVFYEGWVEFIAA